MSQFLFRLASYAWPIRMWKGPGAHGELEVVWEYGRLVVNSAGANQSFGALHAVWRQTFRDAHILERRPASALVLGFGAGSIAHILRRELRLETKITGVDDDPAILRIARDHFGAATMAGLDMHQADAFAFAGMDKGHYDLIAVDLFHNDEFVPGVENAPFVKALRRLASTQGLVAVNTMVEDPQLATRSALLGGELRLHFTEVKERDYEGVNRVFIAL